MAVDASLKDMPRQMLAYRLKSMAGSPTAVAPGVLHGLPTGGPVVSGGVVLSGDGLGDGDGLGVGAAGAVKEGEGL
jgi:hypothetical protein